MKKAWHARCTRQYPWELSTPGRRLVTPLVLGVMHLLSWVTINPASTPVSGAHFAAPVAVQGWDLLLTLLRHPKIVASASAFRQQSTELIDAPEDRGTPPSPRSVQDQTVHQKEGGNTPVTPAVTWSEPTSQAEPGPSSREHSQVDMYCLLKALRLSEGGLG